MQKLIPTFILALLLSGNSFAFDFDDALGKIKNDAKAGVSLDSIADGIEAQVMKKIEGAEGRIEKKLKSYEEKLGDEVQKGLAQIMQEIEIVKTLKARAERAIMIAKIISAIFSCSIIFLLFLVWRVYRKLTGLYKLMDNVRSYKDIEKRVGALEKA
ncbi:MAG: hypothetical protein HON23_06635 [Rickettsiales bacterium]|nr:hypothetical protein [Rickettsiales bacterium]